MSYKKVVVTDPIMGNLLSTPNDAHSLVERPVSTPPPEVQPVEPSMNPAQTSVQTDEQTETKPQTNVSFFYFL